MLLEQVWAAVRGLQDAVGRQALVADRDLVWQMLRQLMAAPAPSTGAMLPGGIFDEVTDIAAALGLADRIEATPGLAGVAGLRLGVDKARPDILVLVQLDRPSFRITSLVDTHQAGVVPAGTFQIPHGLPPIPAKAVRYDVSKGGLRVAAQGALIPNTGAGPAGFRFQVERGRLLPLDTVLLDVPASRIGEQMRGSGAYHAAGILMALGTAAMLRQSEEALLEHNRSCLFLFWDSQGGEIDMHLQPTFGTVLVEGQLGQGSTAPTLDAGVAYSHQVDDVHGPWVPMNYQQLSHDLAASFLEFWPNGVQHHAGPCAAESGPASFRRVIGVMGPPVTQMIGEDERAGLRDIQAGAVWLTVYLAAVLNLVPDIAVRYALGR